MKKNRINAEEEAIMRRAEANRNRILREKEEIKQIRNAFSNYTPQPPSTTPALSRSPVLLELLEK